jgi:hypothetical protein
VIAAGLGVYFYVTRDDSAEAAPPGASWLRARAHRGGGGVELGSSF